MPVRSSDTMLSSHFDNIQWSDATLHSWDDMWEMKLLETELDSPFSNLDADSCVNVDFSDLVNVPTSPKYQIRHHDCMWSGTCIDKSHPSKKKGSIICSSSIHTDSQDISKNIQLKTTTTTAEGLKAATNKSIMTPKNIITTIMYKNNKSISSRSILINANTAKANSSFNNTTTASTTMKSKFLENSSKDQCKSNEFDSFMNSSIANLRPDTPLSLGDDVPDMKSNIDLTPCPSSNRMKFNDPKSLKIINALAEHLEETSSNLNAPLISNFSRNLRSSPSDLTEILQDITFFSDYEDAHDDSSVVDIDDDDQFEENDYKEANVDQKLFASNLKSLVKAPKPMYNHEFISDHSYTRPKGSRYDPTSLGVQTPSDSEEDIDVETIIEKNLPTNPSARDRRALQTTVAHKIARSRNDNSRRRVSDDDSLSSSTSTLSSKGSTPVKYGSQTPSRYVSSSSGHSTATMSRKRHAPGGSRDNNNNVRKKFRSSSSKKLKLSHRHMKAVPQVDQEELDTIEKRNLHNNMERQRRIGLKNLFEELKCHIPSLKEKERAPKVNILREAAAYCTKLRREEEQYAELLKKHNRLLSRVRNLKSSIAQRRHY